MCSQDAQGFYSKLAGFACRRPQVLATLQDAADKVHPDRLGSMSTARKRAVGLYRYASGQRENHQT